MRFGTESSLRAKTPAFGVPNREIWHRIGVETLDIRHSKQQQGASAVRFGTARWLPCSQASEINHLEKARKIWHSKPFWPVNAVTRNRAVRHSKPGHESQGLVSHGTERR